MKIKLEQVVGSMLDLAVTTMSLNEKEAKELVFSTVLGEGTVIPEFNQVLKEHGVKIVDFKTESVTSIFNSITSLIPVNKRLDERLEKHLLHELNMLLNTYEDMPEEFGDKSKFNVDTAKETVYQEFLIQYEKEVGLKENTDEVYLVLEKDFGFNPSTDSVMEVADFLLRV